jgi:hypothetical protein
MNQDGSIIIIEAGKGEKIAILLLREAIWSNVKTSTRPTFPFPSHFRLFIVTTASEPRGTLEFGKLEFLYQKLISNHKK